MRVDTKMEKSKTTKLSVIAWFYVAIALFTGCNAPSIVTGLPGSGGGGASGSSGSSACTNTIVDVGQKANTAASLRGSYSDVKVIPSTVYPSAAYSDSYSGTIKFTYWDGNKFNIEVVAGDGLAAGANTFAVWGVRLGYLPNNVPVIAYSVQNTSAKNFYVKFAIRNTALTSSNMPNTGSWSVGVVDSLLAGGSASNIPLEMAINPIGQILIAYYWGGATEQAKVAMCDVSGSTYCSGASSFQAQASFVDTGAGLAVNGANQLGAGWCYNGGSTYYPVVAYSLAASSKVASCQNSISNCLTNAAWSGTATNVIALTATAPPNVTLLLDPTVVGDNVKVWTHVAAAQPSVTTYATACNTIGVSGWAAAVTTAGAFGVTTTTSVNTSNSWAKILKDQVNGRFHYVGNENTTSISYLNTTTGSGAAAFSTSANWAVSTLTPIETTTVLATNATAGGADISNVAGSNFIYVSYAQSNAAPYDFRIGMVQDFTTTPQSTNIFRFTPDETGAIQFATTGANTRENTAIAATSGGIPAVAYIDNSGTTVATGKLKYALRSGTSSSSSWPIYVIPTTGSPLAPAMAFDSNNKPWVSYFDNVTFKFYLATCTTADGSGQWSTVEVPFPAGGAAAALPTSTLTTVGMYYSSGVGVPVVVVYDSNANKLKSATYYPTTGNWKYLNSSLDGAITATGIESLTSAFDSSGNFVIAYYDLTLTKGKVMSRSSTGVWSGPYSVTAPARGTGISIALDLYGYTGVSYFDTVNNSTYYQYCSSSTANCANGTGWGSAVVLDNAIGSSNWAANDINLYQTSLTYNSSGVPYVLYPKGQNSSGTGAGGLAQATYSGGTATVTQLVAGVGTTSTANAGISPFNFAQPGWDVVSVRTSRGTLAAAYIAAGNFLGVTSCGD